MVIYKKHTLEGDTSEKDTICNSRCDREKASQVRTVIFFWPFREVFEHLF